MITEEEILQGEHPFSDADMAAIDSDPVLCRAYFVNREHHFRIRAVEQLREVMLVARGCPRDCWKAAEQIEFNLLIADAFVKSVMESNKKELTSQVNSDKKQKIRNGKSKT